jgi:hypothetical protein
MKKNIKDYLHLYLGCEVEYPDTDGTPMRAIFTGFSRADGIETTYKKKPKKGEALGDYLSWKPNGYHNSNATKIKPILRPLSDMTKKEMAEYNKLYETLFNMADGINQIRQHAACDHYLLSKGFDLFGLIEAGLAIDKTA